jgi:hypothetical protein
VIRFRARFALFLVLALLAATGCATLAPGADPVVVRAQQALEGGDAIYKDAMEYYFTPGVAAILGTDAIVSGTLTAAEKIGLICLGY